MSSEALPKAFCKWFERESNGNPEVGAYILNQMILKNPDSDNLVWDLLERTGHKNYTRETFQIAAEIALKSAKETA